MCVCVRGQKNDRARAAPRAVLSLPGSGAFPTAVEDARLDLGCRFCFQNSMYAAYFLLICTREANLLHFYLSALEQKL